MSRTTTSPIVRSSICMKTLQMCAPVSLAQTISPQCLLRRGSYRPPAADLTSRRPVTAHSSRVGPMPFTRTVTGDLNEEEPLELQAVSSARELAGLETLLAEDRSPLGGSEWHRGFPPAIRAVGDR